MYIYTCIYMYTSVFVHTYVYEYIYECVYIYVYVYIYLRIYTYMYMYIHSALSTLQQTATHCNKLQHTATDVRQYTTLRASEAVQPLLSQRVELFNTTDDHRTASATPLTPPELAATVSVPPPRTLQQQRKGLETRAVLGVTDIETMEIDNTNPDDLALDNDII